MSRCWDARGIVRRVTEVQPFRTVIGEGVRRARESAGVRQDDVSAAARVHGLAWSRAKVAALEAGEKAISGEELLLLPAVLTEACHRPVRLSDLIAPDTRVALSPTVAPAGYVLPKILASEDLGSLPAADAGRPTLAARVYPGRTREAAARKSRADWGRFTSAQDRLDQFIPEDMTSDDVDRLFEGVPSEAERKAAKRLAEDPHVVVGLARLLWGRSLTEERDRLVDEHAAAGADPGRLRALRGRVTRQLVERLAEELQRPATGGDR
jgi:hypothetical protein